MSDVGPGSEGSDRGRSYFGLLRDSRFLAYFLSVSAGDVGYAVYAVSIPFLAYRIGGPVVLGLVLFVEFGIYSLSFATGPVIDRVRDLRSVLLVGYALQASLAILLGLLAAEGLLTVPVLIAVVVPLSAVWDFTWTAMNAVPPRTVRAGELMRANGLLGAVSGGNQIAGFAAGAALLLLVGPGGGLFLYGLLNALAALLALGVRAPRSGSPVPGFGAAFREGWTYFVGGPGRPRLQISLASAAEASLTTAPILLLTVVTVGAGSPGRYAADFTAFAVGGIAGSLVLGQFAPRGRLGYLLAGVGIGEALALYAAVASAGAGAASALPWALVGAVDGAFYSILLTYFQATSPPALVGRTVANAYLFRGLSRATGGLVLAGLLVGVAPLYFAGVAAIVLAVVAVGGLALPAVRRMGF